MKTRIAYLATLAAFMSCCSDSEPEVSLAEGPAQSPDTASGSVLSLNEQVTESIAKENESRRQMIEQRKKLAAETKAAQQKQAAASQGGGAQEVEKTNYQHNMEIRVPQAIEELEAQRIEAIRKMEAAREKARRRLAEWEAKGNGAMPSDPVEAQNVRFRIQQESEEERRDTDISQVRRDWELRIENLKRDIQSGVEMVRKNQEGRAKGYLGMKVKDYDLRFVDSAPAMLSEVDEMGRKLMAVHESEAWKQGEVELKQIHDRIDGLVSGRDKREAQEAAMARAAEDAKKFPWTTPGEASGFAFVGNELWNLVTLERARAPIYHGTGTASLIRNHPDLVAWLPNPGDRSAPIPCPDLSDAGQGKPPGSDAYYVIAKTPGLPTMEQFRLSPSDWRRFIFLAEGDLWRGTVDWKTLQAIEVKRLTNTSQLGRSRILHWHGRTAWLWTGLSPEKPVATIDLISGAIAELPSYGIFPDHEDRVLASPSGELLAALSEERILALDVKNSRLISIANHFPIPVTNPSGNKIRQEQYESRMARIGDLKALDGKPVWLPGEKLLSLSSGNRLVALDLRAGTSTLLPEPPPLAAPSLERAELRLEQHLTGTPYVSIKRTWDEQTPERIVQKSELLLLDADKGEYRPFPEGAGWLGQVSDRLVFYTISDGGLSRNGSWIWDLQSGETHRLTPLFLSGGYAERDWTFVPERHLLLAHANGGGGANDSLRKLLLFEFKNGLSAEARELPVDFASATFKGGYLSRVRSEEAELGFSADAPDPWSATAALPSVGEPTPSQNAAQ